MNILATGWVPESLIDELEERLDKVQRRARRIGFPEPITVVGPEGTRIGTRFSHTGTPDEKHAPVVWKQINVIGDDLKLGDWTLIASIDPIKTKDGKRLAFFRPVPAKVVPESYRDSDPSLCEHCNTRRYRTETFLVELNGEYKQLGRNCVKDFLGHNPNSIIPYLQLLGDFIDYTEDTDWGPRQEWSWTPTAVLAQASWVVAIDGFYVSKAKAEEFNKDATSEIVRDLLYPPTNEYEKRRAAKYEQEEYFQKSREIFDASLAEIDKLNRPDNDWLYNIWLAFQAEQLKSRQVGIAASAVILGLRSLSDGQERAKNGKVASEYVGAISNKHTASVEVTGFNQFEGAYGTTYLISMVDEAGNHLKWFATNPPDAIEVGAKVTITGTVKKHEEYKGLKQTLLTRCKVVN